MAPQSLTLGRADFNGVLVYGVTVWALLDGEEIIVSEYFRVLAVVVGDECWSV